MNDQRHKRISRLFLLLVVLQACHSVEEYLGRLYDVFPPARWATVLVSPDRRSGFLAINIVIVVVAFLCWIGPVRRRWPSFEMFIWPWIVIETINGIGHPAWSIARGVYTPGVVTAVPLLVVAVLLGVTLTRTHDFPSPNGRGAQG